MDILWQNMVYYKNVLKNVFFMVSTFLTSINSLSAIQLSCISMNNQACKVRPEIQELMKQDT